MKTQALLDRDRCPLCGCGERAVHIPFSDIPVVRCADCGFIYSGKVLSEQGLAEYYENDFGSQRHRQGQIINAKVNAWMLGRLLDMDAIGRMLDVGTGYGFLLAELEKRYGIGAAGVELSRQEASYATTELGVNVINTMLGEAGLEPESFDLVASFEVLEHTSDPIDFIRETAGYVKPGGYLLIATDNFSNRWVRAMGAGFPKWIPHSHISHFSPSTLEQAAECSGRLSVVGRMSYTPWEILIRGLLPAHKSPAEAFNLQETLAHEMGGTYRLFALRKAINGLWVRLAHRRDLEGEMMYLLLKKGR